MLLSSEDTSKYPDLFWWMLHALPAIPYDKPKVYAAYQKFAGRFFGFPHHSSPELSWGFGPYLRVDFANMVKCEDEGEEQIGSNLYQRRLKIRWYGFTPPNYSANVIIVAGDLVQGMMNPEVGSVLEATVLHELIHWTRLWAGQDVADEEPAYAFEEEAYGRRVVRTWESCFSQAYYYITPR